MRSILDDTSRVRPLEGIILDVDGVVLDTPHAQAWRDALDEVIPGARLTAPLYQAAVAGRSRLEGAMGLLKALDVPDGGPLARRLAAIKQSRFEAAITAVPVRAFPDALRLIRDASRQGLPLAAASASRNAARLLAGLWLEDRPLGRWFRAELCGLALPGKPDPALYQAAARALDIPADHSLVIEDAPAGLVAASRAGAICLGVARDCRREPLVAAGADLVIDTLDGLDRDALWQGRLREIP